MKSGDTVYVDVQALSLTKSMPLESPVQVRVEAVLPDKVLGVIYGEGAFHSVSFKPGAERGIVPLTDVDMAFDM